MVPIIPNLKTSCLQVVAFDVDLPVKQAFNILHEQVSILFMLRLELSIICMFDMFSLEKIVLFYLLECSLVIVGQTWDEL